MSGYLAVLNGPNLNLLGQREPEVYGTATLADVQALCDRTAERFGLRVRFEQSNHEGQLIDWVHEMRTEALGFVVNLGAFTHTSIALRDALITVGGPIIEVHISNVHAREAFRKTSYVCDLATGVIVGCGIQGYQFAVEKLADLVGAGS